MSDDLKKVLNECCILGRMAEARIEELEAEIERLRADAQSAPDEDYPDCATPREREMYAALMLLTSALAARRTEWRNWKQGGGMIEPIVMKALRLDPCSLSSTQRNEDQP